MRYIAGREYDYDGCEEFYIIDSVESAEFANSVIIVAEFSDRRMRDIALKAINEQMGNDLENAENTNY